MKQTAVDFLSEKYMYVTWLRNRDEISAEEADKMRLNYLLAAKEIEKMQAINDYNAGHDNGSIEFDMSGQQYYNITYLEK